MKRADGSKILLGLGAGVALAVLLARRAGRRSSLRVVPGMDLDRYMGKWYEIAHLPVWFQRDCAGDVTARYALLPDGRVAVLNQCRTRNGRVKSASGLARVAQRKGPNTRLKVSFFGPFSGDYWVIDLDPEYRWAVVGEPSRRCLWILSREPQMDPAIFDGIVQRAEAQGYVLDRLVRTRHTASTLPDFSI